MNNEVNVIKNKYKKLKLTVLLTIFAIVSIYGGNLIITALKLQRVFVNNINIDLGNNYKITKINDNVQSITYYKNGIYNMVLSNGKHGFYIKDGEIYFISYDNKEYSKRDDIKEFVKPTPSTDLLNHFIIDNESVNSFKQMLLLAYQTNTKFSSEIIDGQKFDVIEIKAFGETLWVNSTNHLVEKENMHGQIVSQKVEKDTVTDNDVKAPWELGFTLKTLEK